MRQDFEAELQAARSEVAKAQDALAASEDRIRAAEAVDRARLESEWQAKLAGVQEENQRLRDELVYRTQVGQVRFGGGGYGGQGVRGCAGEGRVCGPGGGWRCAVVQPAQVTARDGGPFALPS